jgi:hypothetical protein
MTDPFPPLTEFDVKQMPKPRVAEEIPMLRLQYRASRSSHLADDFRPTDTLAVASNPDQLFHG